MTPEIGGFRNQLGYTTLGYILGVLTVLLGLVQINVAPFLPLMVFRAGGYGKWLGYLAVGALLGIVTPLIASATAALTGFLPGLLGTAAGWIVMGWIITFLVLVISRAFGSGKRS